MVCVDTIRKTKGQSVRGETDLNRPDYSSNQKVEPCLSLPRSYRHVLTTTKEESCPKIHLEPAQIDHRYFCYFIAYICSISRGCEARSYRLASRCVPDRPYFKPYKPNQSTASSDSAIPEVPGPPETSVLSPTADDTRVREWTIYTFSVVSEQSERHPSQLARRCR